MAQAQRTLAQRIAEAEAKAARLKTRARRVETRGLILLGLAAITLAEARPDWRDALEGLVDVEARQDNKEAMRLAVERRGGRRPADAS